MEDPPRPYISGSFRKPVIRNSTHAAHGDDGAAPETLHTRQTERQLVVRCLYVMKLIVNSRC
jgi:hypothetical protein